MAVPSSGELELYGDIGTELGVAQSNVTLHGMSQTAGFTPPDAMSEFYGYDPTPPLTTSFNTVLYTGNGGSQTFNIGFRPDFIWFKARNFDWFHISYDSIRGSNKGLVPSGTSAEFITTDGLASFNDNGFTISGGGWITNRPGYNYVAWALKAGGAAVTNNNGSITSQVSANAGAGFSIVSYTGGNLSGTTVGHGLGKQLDMLIVKNRSDGTDQWITWHKDVERNSTSTDTFTLKGGTIAILNGANAFGNYNYDGQMGSIGGENLIAYCFAEVAGFSKFGSYTGSAPSTTTVNLGFQPAFVMIKNASSTMNWVIFDNKRDATNPNEALLYPNLSNAEDNVPGAGVNFNTDGFTVLVTSGGWINNSGQNYIYMAFANQF